jgi:hypothetical protein
MNRLQNDLDRVLFNGLDLVVSWVEWPRFQQNNLIEDKQPTFRIEHLKFVVTQGKYLFQKILLLKVYPHYPKTSQPLILIVDQLDHQRICDDKCKERGNISHKETLFKLTQGECCTTLQGVARQWFAQVGHKIFQFDWKVEEDASLLSKQCKWYYQGMHNLDVPFLYSL